MYGGNKLVKRLSECPKGNIKASNISNATYNLECGALKKIQDREKYNIGS